MTKYILRRFVNYAILTGLATVFAYIAASSFFRPRNRYLGRNPPLDEASIDAILSAQGVNDKDPVLLRTWWWIENFVTAPFTEKLGTDSSNQSVVVQMLGDPGVWLKFWEQEWLGRSGVSLRLLIIGSLLAALVGVAAGVWGAVRQYKASDQIISYSSFILISTPTFVGGVLLMIIATKLNNALGFQLITFTKAYTPGLEGFWTV
ncbi:MAG: ABC transporter permease, partial [Actinomycetales bacterium]|nr:ABC transporter permease [Actinomycetales bacterium]